MPVNDAVATRLEHLQLVCEVSGSSMQREKCSWERLASIVFNWKRRSGEVERQREGGMVCVGPEGGKREESEWTL